MENSLNIFKPIRKTCPGQSVKYPITKLSPENWLLAGSNAYSFSSLDGYLINVTGQVTALMSRYEFEGGYKDRNEFTNTLLEKFGQEIQANLVLANLLKVPYRLFLWPKDFPLQDQLHERKIIVFLVTSQDHEIDLSDAKWINIKGLEAGIKKYRGRSYELVKPLSSSNSNLECYLANHSKNPWPGDIDGIITDKISGQVKSIIEFKTHNINSLIENQYIGKYGKQDWRRFEVLYRLQDAIQSAQGNRPKLFYVVWGTGDYTNHQNLKIDELTNGKSINTQLLPKPEFDTFSSELFELLT